MAKDESKDVACGLCDLLCDLLCALLCALLCWQVWRRKLWEGVSFESCSSRVATCAYPATLLPCHGSTVIERERGSALLLFEKSTS